NRVNGQERRERVLGNASSRKACAASSPSFAEKARVRMTTRVRWRGLELPTRVVTDPKFKSDTYGRFSVEPFERGFGTTVGNSLRRVLLSSLEGAAVSSIKIKGVTHEFSPLKGVM